MEERIKTMLPLLDEKQRRIFFSIGSIVIWIRWNLESKQVKRCICSDDSARNKGNTNRSSQ